MSEEKIIKKLEELKEIVIGGEAYHQLVCVYAKNLFGCEPTEAEIYAGDVASRVVYKSEAGTIIIIKSNFGDSHEYDNERHRSIENIAYILEDKAVIEELINKAKNKDGAVILISGTFDDPSLTKHVIESEGLRNVLDKNDPEDYSYFISKFLQNYAEKNGNSFSSGKIGEVIHIVE